MNTKILIIILLLINADYSALTEEIERRHESPKFKVGDRVRFT